MTSSDPTRAALNEVLDSLASADSRRVYEGDWTRFATWLALEGVEVIDTRPRHVITYIAKLRGEAKAKATIGRILSVIREVFGALAREEVVPTNPAREVKKPKMDSAPKTPHLDVKQVQALLSLPAETWAERRSRICLRLLFGLGWRRSEIARMRADDIDFEKATITCKKVKGDKPLTVGIPPWLMDDLKEWYRYVDDAWVLPRSQSDPRPCSGAMVYRIVKEAELAAGLPAGSVTPHGLRRTFITIAGKLGATLKERQLAVGHSSQATTEWYDRAREAAENAPGRVFADLLKKGE